MPSHYRLLLAAAAALACAGASAQPLVTKGPVSIEKAHDCPAPSERSKQHECCRVKVVIDETGKATSAKANCTFAPLEPVTAQCQLEVTHETRIRTGGKREGYTHTFTQTYLARGPRNIEEFKAMSREADKRCDLIKDPD
jgi:hypothetical protein